MMEVRTADGREVVWQAQPRQDVALRCPALEVCYGGTKGCGKTDVLVAAPLEQAQLAHAKYKATGRKQRGRWIIFRKNLKNLNDITTRTKEIYPLFDPAMGMNGWTKIDKRWEFSSGYVVDLAHLDGPDDHLGYNGQELTGFSIDQAEEVPEEVYNFLFMQVRSRDADMRRILKILLTTNPGGKHGDWIKKRFVEGCKPHNTIIRQSIQTSKGPIETSSAFIPAKLHDNKFLADDGRYEANLMRLPEHMRRMYLDGDWNVVVGAYFANVFDQKKHVIKSFPIPGSWEVRGGLDWGTTAPACWLIGAKDNDGNVFIVDELYGPGVTGRTFGERMQKKVSLQKWSADRKWSIADFYTMMDRQARHGTGGDGRWSNPAAGIASYGFRLFDANKDRLGGNEQTLERLLLKPNGKPSLYIFGDRCPNLARTLPALMADPHDTEDVATDGEDHAFDSLKYLELSWPINTKPELKKNGDVEFWLHMATLRGPTADAEENTISTGYDG